MAVGEAEVEEEVVVEAKLLEIQVACLVADRNDSVVSVAEEPVREEKDRDCNQTAPGISAQNLLRRSVIVRCQEWAVWTA